MTPPRLVRLPDGSRVIARGLRRGSRPAPPPRFGLYLGQRYAPPWEHEHLAWPDFRTPRDARHAVAALHRVHGRARRGERVEVACRGGRGRTGTALACLAVLAGIDPLDAVAWVRSTYDRRAVETTWQRRWVRHFPRAVRAYRGGVTDPVPALADERFVSLVTYRRSGQAVATPVWIAREGDALVVTTGAASGKVKRLRREPRATLRPCDRRGRVADGAPEHAVRAEVVTDPARQEPALATLAGKYGVEWRALTVVERVVGLVRGGTRDRVILRLTA